MGGLLDMRKSAVVLQKPSGTVAISVEINAIQRKFYNALLYLAKQELRKNPDKVSFKIPLTKLKSVLDISERDKNNAYYIEKVEELTGKKAKYNILGKDKTIWGIFVLLASVEFTKDERNGTIEVKFEVPEFVRRAMIDPHGIYANINLVVIRGLKSKYSIILYELVKDYVKGESEIPEMSMDKFRELFGIKGKYKLIPMLKQRVLDVAVKELNSNGDIGFTVSYELRKEGRTYTSIKFHVKPKPGKLLRKAPAIDIKDIHERDNLTALLSILPGNCRVKEKVISTILAGLRKYDFDYVKSQVEYVSEILRKQRIRNIAGYLKKAMEDDYAGTAEVDIDIVGEDWKRKLIGKVVSLKGEQGRYEITVINNPDEDDKCLVRLDNVETGEVLWRRISSRKLRALAEHKGW